MKQNTIAKILGKSAPPARWIVLSETCRVALTARISIGQVSGQICALCCLLIGFSAFAETDDTPLERARHHMELGQEAFENSRHEEAAGQFVKAHAASPFAAFLYNAGLAWERAGVNEKASEFYRRYLEADPAAADAAVVEAKIQSLLPGVKPPDEKNEETLEEKNVEITEVEMKSLISVRTNPEDAEVRILDREGTLVASSKGLSAHTVVRGTYTVEASHREFRTVQTKLTVSPGEVYVVVVEMSQGAFLGFLRIETDVPGADVYIGDRAGGKVGSTPFGNVIPTGRHKIWVEKPGYLPLETTVEVKLGEKLGLSLQLERLPFGLLVVKTNVPGGEVFWDGASLGPAPLEKRVAPGRHQLKVVAQGMKDYSKQIIVSRGQLTKALVRMNPKPSRTSAWVSLGVSAAFFAGGGVAGIMALRLNNELDDARNKGRLASDDPRIMKGFMWGLGADLAFGVGTVVGALCLYYFLRDPLPSSEGKHFDPVELTENPNELGAEGEKKESGADSVKGSEKPNVGAEIEGPPTGITHPSGEGSEPQSGGEGEDAPPLPNSRGVDGDLPTTGQLDRGPRLMFAPVLTSQSAGLGIVVVF